MRNDADATPSDPRLSYFAPWRGDEGALPMLVRSEVPTKALRKVTSPSRALTALHEHRGAIAAVMSAVGIYVVAVQALLAVALAFGPAVLTGPIAGLMLGVLLGQATASCAPMLAMRVLERRAARFEQRWAADVLFGPPTYKWAMRQAVEQMTAAGAPDFLVPEVDISPEEDLVRMVHCISSSDLLGQEDRDAAVSAAFEYRATSDMEHLMTVEGLHDRGHGQQVVKEH